MFLACVRPRAARAGRLLDRRRRDGGRGGRGHIVAVDQPASHVLRRVRPSLAKRARPVLTPATPPITSSSAPIPTAPSDHQRALPCIIPETRFKSTSFIAIHSPSFPSIHHQQCLPSVLSFASPPTARAIVPPSAPSSTAALQCVYDLRLFGAITINLFVQGLTLSATDVQTQLSRRRPGQSNLTTPVSVTSCS